MSTVFPPDTPPNKHWHNIALMISVCSGLLCGGAVYGALRADFSALEAQVERTQNKVEKQVARTLQVGERLSRVEGILDTMSDTLKRIDTKLDRERERGRNK